MQSALLALARSGPCLLRLAVQYHVVTELEKLACLHGQAVLDAEEFRMAKRRLIQA